MNTASPALRTLDLTGMNLDLPDALILDLTAKDLDIDFADITAEPAVIGEAAGVRNTGIRGTNTKDFFELPDMGAEMIRLTSRLPLTLMGLAERLAVQYNGHVIHNGRNWEVCVSGDWDIDWDDCYISTAVMAVIRSLTDLEPFAGGAFATGNRDHQTAGERFENTPGIIAAVLDMARHMFASETF